MQRISPLLAYLLLCVNCFAQQYPFVHYSPKDGLISNQVRRIYQDSKGRLYFTSMNGLSVYDGSRFINYTSKNGLNTDIVNGVMEMGDDSVWVITNSNKLNCLVNGKLKNLVLKDSIPIINSLHRTANGTYYAAADQGLFLLKKDRFIKLPFIDEQGNDYSSFITTIISTGNYLLIQRDHTLLGDEGLSLFLYNTITGKIEQKIKKVYFIDKACDGRVWISLEKNIVAADTTALKKGKFILQELPLTHESIKKLGGHFVIFDRQNNCWLGNGHVLIKAMPDGSTTSFTTASGLNMLLLHTVFEDREGTIWIATNNAGVSKLVHGNFSVTEDPWGISPITDISYNPSKDEIQLYSFKTGQFVAVDDSELTYYKVERPAIIDRIIETPYGVFGIGWHTVYKMILKNNSLTPVIFFSDSSNNLGTTLVDRNGNLIICGTRFLTAIINGKMVFRTSLTVLTDYTAPDNSGNVWAATRDGNLIAYQLQPGNHNNYLKEKKIFKNEISGISPRSIIIDRTNNIWIGTRSHGIHVFRYESGKLMKQFVLTTASGLSDDFTWQLACDAENNIWAGSASGLDKISLKNGIPVIENLTRQNNIYQSVYKVVLDKNNTAWARISNGIIRIIPANNPPATYTPTLLISMIKAGADTIPLSQKTHLSYRQNNLSFYFAATSFLNEKQVLYSYRLLKGSNKEWSEPSNNGMLSFIDLPSGNYTLEIKARFPAGRYPEQVVHYNFTIAPPWWQTWWFRSLMAVVLITLLALGIRSYYRRKLEKHKLLLEKQQAIERERTRIATDMHDDLGAGLSRIKFLSESIRLKNTTGDNILADIEKVSVYSDEMAEKLGEIVWALNDKNDTVADLVAFTRSYAIEYLSSQNVQCVVDSPLNLPETFIPGETRQHIFLSVKECLHNIVKHAGATKVSLTIRLNPGIEIIIHDNGKGIDWNSLRPFSNGLDNIRKRMKEINGEVSFYNHEGTKVVLDAPLKL